MQTVIDFVTNNPANMQCKSWEFHVALERTALCVHGTVTLGGMFTRSGQSVTVYYNTEKAAVAWECSNGTAYIPHDAPQWVPSDESALLA